MAYTRSMSSSLACAVACSFWFLVAVESLQQRNSLGYAGDGDPTVLAASYTPPRLGPSAAIDPEKAAVTIKNLQTFIRASATDGYASIIIMGDSTMAGVVSDFLGVTKEAEEYKLLLHTTNDRPVSVRYTNDHTVVPPGGEWYEPSALKAPLTNLVLERSQDAQRVLHSLNCTWAGGISTYLYTGGPLEGLAVHDWGFIPEYGDACWKPCMREAVKAFKASAVLWNIGFHLLNQKFDKDICDRRQNMAKLNCGDYKELVKLGTKDFLDAAPIVIYRTTNHLCQDKHRKFICKQLNTEYDDWQNETKRPHMEHRCHEHCPLMGDLQCFDWLMSTRSTNLFHAQALHAIAELQRDLPERASKIHVLDAYTSSKECCDTGCNATDDGEHYTGLDRGLVDEVAVLLSRSV